MIRNGTAVVVICRAASQPLVDGSALGYKCALCSEPLQVGARGRNQLAGGALPMCNPCGLDLMESRLDRGGKTHVEQTPDAAARIARGRCIQQERIENLLKRVDGGNTDAE
jgi:hypothetical protein